MPEASESLQVGVEVLLKCLKHCWKLHAVVAPYTVSKYYRSALDSLERPLDYVVQPFDTSSHNTDKTSQMTEADVELDGLVQRHLADFASALEVGGVHDALHPVLVPRALDSAGDVEGAEARM